MSKFIDMTGWIMKEHGVPNSRITVLKKNTEKYHPVEWWCQCECGKYFLLVVPHYEMEQLKVAAVGHKTTRER